VAYQAQLGGHLALDKRGGEGWSQDHLSLGSTDRRSITVSVGE
jgi:hypothetical protein